MALMALPHPSLLGVTAQDDDMEISSDAGRVEDDHDIDLVDGDDDGDIDYMLEDTHSDQGSPRIDEMPDAGRDDIMYDDDLDEITYAEDDMHEDVPVPDEHLIDVSEIQHDSEFGQFAEPHVSEVRTTPTQPNPSDSFNASTTSVLEVPESDVLTDTVDYLEHSYPDPATTTNAESTYTELELSVPEVEIEIEEQEQEDDEDHIGTVISQNDPQVEELSTAALLYDDPEAASDETSKTQQPSESTNLTPNEDAHKPDLIVDEPNGSAPGYQLPLPKPIEPSVPAESLPKEPILSIHQDEPGIQRLPHRSSNDLEELQASDDEACLFHTTMVDYEGEHISLFPPMHDDDADTFLLSDPTLADKTLVDLFRACRQVLGASIDNDLELEIHSEDLGLTIAEDSIHCMTTSFSQLVDVYVTLSQQDGVEHPGPFFITLTKKSRWSSRLSALYVAADGSRGLSAMQVEPFQDYDGDDYEDEHSNGENIAPAQCGTEPKDEDIKGDIIGEQSASATTTTTDTEPAQGKLPAFEDDAVNFDENALKSQDNLSEIGGNDILAQADNCDLGIVKQDNVEAVPEALVEDDSLDQIGGVENDDEESPGSSTVQGENDPPQSNNVHDGTPQDQRHSTLNEEDLKKSNSGTNVEDQASALADKGEWSEQNQQDESHPDDSYDNEGQSENPQAAAEDWDQVGHNDFQTYNDGDLKEVPQFAEAAEHSFESEWATFDEELDFDVGNEEQHIGAAFDTTPQHPTSSGIFRVPDVSAGEEEEDSITYDDDELNLPAQPDPDTVQARSTSQSPLGKRSRDNDEDRGDGGSDKESKRLKS